MVATRPLAYIFLILNVCAGMAAAADGKETCLIDAHSQADSEEVLQRVISFLTRLLF